MKDLPEVIQESNDDDSTAGCLTVGVSLADAEKQLILETLKSVGGNRTRAVEILGISIRTLRNKLKGYQVQDPVLHLVAE